jgi:parvulin-like peptidyl-prolyl isomerase
MTAEAPPSGWSSLSQVYPRRAFVLAGLGAGLGLALAGVALFTAKGTSTLVVPADAVAMVNQQPISRIDYDAQLRVLAPEPGDATPAVRKQVLDDMIREELFVQRAKELDLAVMDPEIRAAMVKAVEAQAAANVVTARATEDQIRAYYDAHRDKYASEGTMTVRDLVFPQSSAEAARAALTGGSPVAAVLARFGGRDTAKTQGEEFYFAAKIHLGDALFTAAKALNDGAVSPPIAQADGAHLLVMASNHRPRPYSYEEARTQVASDRQTDAIARYEAADAKFLHKRASILIAQDMR